MSFVGVIGILVFLIGLHLQWQARREIFYWVAEFVRILRREVSSRADLDKSAAMTMPAEASAAGASRRSKGTLRMIGGFALAFIGPLLLILDLVL